MITDQQYTLLLHYRNDKNMTITTAAASGWLMDAITKRLLMISAITANSKPAAA